LRDGGDILEIWRVNFGFRVLEVAGDEPVVQGGAPDVAVDKGSVGIVVRVAGERSECVEPGVARTDAVADETAPELALGKEPHTKGGDDTEVVGAAAEGSG
jgi:hypothetical protein